MYFQTPAKKTHLQYLCSGLLKDSLSQSTHSSEGCKLYALRHARKCNEQCFQYKAVFNWNHHYLHLKLTLISLFALSMNILHLN